jgi:hypothetical protein
VYGGEVDLVRAHDADQPLQVSLTGNAMEALVDVLHAPVLFVASNLAILCGVRTTSVRACAVAPVRVCGAHVVCACGRGRQGEARCALRNGRNSVESTMKTMHDTGAPL